MTNQSTVQGKHVLIIAVSLLSQLTFYNAVIPRSYTAKVLRAEYWISRSSKLGQWRDVRSVQVWRIQLQSDWSMILPPSGACDKTGCQLESTLPRPPMESLDPSCTKLKAAYDTCFNAWFRDRFLKGHSDHDGTCGQLFEIYQQCLTVRHNRALQWLVFFILSFVHRRQLRRRS